VFMKSEKQIKILLTDLTVILIVRHSTPPYPEIVSPRAPPWKRPTANFPKNVQRFSIVRANP
jgi:hypothetical protein